MTSLLPCLQTVSATTRRVEHKNELDNKLTAHDFTPFQFMPWGEVPATHLLAFFLDARQDHGQGTLFQELFIAHLRRLPQLGARLPETPWQVVAERRHEGFGQIDLLLTAGKGSFAICLENKPRDQTIDQYQQLTRYRQLLQNRYQDNYVLLYLSRTERPPHEDSLDPALRKELEGSGHYANLTYEKFILPLLDAWHEVVKAESLRLFLRQFRHRIEQWLTFPTTKTTKLMQDQEVAQTLISSPEHLQAAFDIAQAIEPLKRRLSEQLTQALVASQPGLEGESHWLWKGFLTGHEGNPYLLRRLGAGSLPAAWTWGRFSIGLEWSEGRLFYGIRFDKQEWHPTDRGAAKPAADAPGKLAALVGEPAQCSQWWLWWAWIDLETKPAIFTAIANGSLVEVLQPIVNKLAQALDSYCAANAELGERETQP